MKKGILLLLTAVIPLLDIAAQESTKTDSVSVKVYFRKGESAVDPAFRDNGPRLEAFIRQLRESLREGRDTHMSPLRIIGSASPEGKSTLNLELARKRAENTARWLRRGFGSDSISVMADSSGIDWKTLAVLVEESDMQYKDEVLDILHNTPVWVIRDGKVTDSRVRQLGMLHGGKQWFYMNEHIFPELRNSSVQVTYSVTVLEAGAEEQPDEASSGQEETPETANPQEPGPSAEPEEPQIPQEPAPQPPQVPAATRTSGTKDSRPFHMAVRTNMLYDAALVPNIGVEFHLGKGWTIGANWMYAWWKSDRCHYYWRTYGGDLGIRKYFGAAAEEKPLQGHHLGVYGQILTYDVELGGRGYLGDRWSWGAGIEYGYSLPVAKRLNIDFSVGVGYLTGEYKEYLPIDTHYVWQATRQRHWIGPTKAEISLVWLLGKHNCNNKGRRR